MRLKSYAAGQWVEGTGRRRHPGERGHRRAGRRDRQHGPRFRRHAATTRAASAARRLRKLTFHQRALRLKALAAYLMERKEEFYELSKATGATRTDAWIDVEGGIGTLFAYASKGRRELPNATFYLDGPPEILSRGGSFVGPAHLRAARRRRGPHQRLQLPGLGHAREARADAARRHAGHRQAGEPDGLPDRADVPPDGRVRHLPRGLAAAGLRQHRRSARPPDRAGRRHLHRLGRHRPAAASSTRASSSNAVRFTMEADSLNFSLLGPDAAPGSPEFDLFVKEVAREMTVKAGQKCTAIRRALRAARRRSGR